MKKRDLRSGVIEKFKLGQPLPETASAAVDDAIFAMNNGELTKTPIKVGDDWVIFGVIKKYDADLSEFAKQRDQVRQTLLNERQSQVYEDYITAANQRMKRDGKIKIYDDVLNSIEVEEEPAAVPGLPPGLNFPTK